VFRPDNNPPDQPEQAGYIVFYRGNLVSDMRAAQPCLLDSMTLRLSDWEIMRSHFLGYWHEQAVYAAEIEARCDPDPLRYQCGSLYQLLGRVDDQLFALAGRASQVLDWERDHQYCGRCGAAMVEDSTERAMRCQPCGTISYPRIAPCVITLVHRDEELLLARNVNFPRPMYSTLAGFIEAGETVEETLAREVREEVGVEVTNLRYFQSQSWPFPNQLMLGFFADYAGGDIVCDMTEIADARWFHASDLPPIPPDSSVAGKLIRHYIESLKI
jgi:NAD+ diphosphatase